MISLKTPDFAELTGDVADGDGNVDVVRRLLQDPVLMPISEMARKLKVSPSTVRRWIEVGTQNPFSGRRVKLDAIVGTQGRMSSMAAHDRMMVAINASPKNKS
jgi:hypothetical protein